MIRTRRLLDAIAPYVPGSAGRDVEAALAAARLASNERPQPPAAPVVAAISAAAAAANRYPDDDVTELTGAIAATFGVDTAMVAVGNGSSELLARFALATCDPGDNVVFAWPSFVMYPILAQLTGAEVRRVPLVSGRHDLAAMAAAVDARTRIVYVCTPNNPTGCAVAADELSALLDAVPGDVLVVLDEAYAEYVDRSADPCVHADGVASVVCGGLHPNAVVLRTFSKAYGLAGLRCGYAIGDGDVLAQLGRVRLPFVVNALAQHAARAALAHREECLAPVAGTIAERGRVRDALVATGLDVPESHGNFVWVAVPGAAAELAGECERAGVLVRPLGADGVRVTVGTEAENDRFLDVSTAWNAARRRR